MNPEEQTQRYKELQVKSISQEKLILMLYDGSVKFLNNALEALKTKKYDVVNDNLVRVQMILTELMVSLDLSVGELAASMYSFYQFMHDKLVEGNVKKEAEPIQEVIEMLLNLREVWVKALEARKHDTRTEKPVKPTTSDSGFDFVG